MFDSNISLLRTAMIYDPRESISISGSNLGRSSDNINTAPTTITVPPEHLRWVDPQLLREDLIVQAQKQNIMDKHIFTSAEVPRPRSTSVSISELLDGPIINWDFRTLGIVSSLPEELKDHTIKQIFTSLEPKRVRAIIDLPNRQWTYRASMPPNLIPATVYSDIKHIRSLSDNFEPAPRLNLDESPYPYFNYAIDTLVLENPRCDPDDVTFSYDYFQQACRLLKNSNINATACKSLRNLEIVFCPTFPNWPSILSSLDDPKFAGLQTVTLVGHDHYNVPHVGVNYKRMIRENTKFAFAIFRRWYRHSCYFTTVYRDSDGNETHSRLCAQCVPNRQARAQQIEAAEAAAAAAAQSVPGGSS